MWWGLPAPVSFTMFSSSLLVSKAIFWISFSDWPACAMHGTIGAFDHTTRGD